MNVDSAHPSFTASPVSAAPPIAVVDGNGLGDDFSDSDLSQFKAEIEQNLSSVSSASSTLSGANENVSDDAMDVDSEDDVRPSHAGKGRRRGSTKEYYDPELYLLRRSVCR
jgi:hypothetical protein